MKRFIPILFIFFLSVSNLAAQDTKLQLYGTIGISFFNADDLDTFGFDKSGIGLHLGLQITDLIGIEIATNGTPAFDREDLLTRDLDILDLLYREPDEIPIFESIRGNYRYRYSSLMGTLTRRFEHNFSRVNDFSIVVKGGVALYSAERQTFLHLENKADISSLITEDGSGMVFSVGALYHATEKQDYEFSVTKVFGDASYLSFNICWKYKFFKF